MELELESVIRSTAERLGPAVVGLRRSWGCGTVVAPGQVLTNAHNLRHDEVTVSFADGRSEQGRVAGSDPDLDLAVITVDTGETEPISWSFENQGSKQDGHDVTIGRGVLALSNPGGRGLHVAPGFVSSVTGSFRGPRGRRVRAAIEHTAPLPRGSSGGPLLDLEGRLIGINSVRLNPGLVLAIPVSGSIAEGIEALGRGQQPEPLRLGVAVAPPHAARKLRSAVGLPDRPGVLVRAVQDGSPADRAGLSRGDLIVAVGDQSLDGLDGLYESLDAARAGGRLDLTIVRGAEEREVPVTFDQP